MPAEIRRQPMSVEDYHLLPFHPGWKVEYFHGEAVFQPRENCAYGTLPVPPQLAPRAGGIAFRAADSLDAPALVALFRAAFLETPEYAGWPLARFDTEAEKVVAGFLSGKRGPISDATRLAVRTGAGADDGAVVGAACVVKRAAGAALLEVLMVAPAWQRRGIARALAAAVLGQLARTGREQLISRWHLANEASVAWHRQIGFREEPDLFNAKLYLRAAEHEIWRLEKLGQLPEPRRAELVQTQQHWQREIARLETLLDAGDKGGAFACFRFER